MKATKTSNTHTPISTFFLIFIFTVLGTITIISTFFKKPRINLPLLDQTDCNNNLALTSTPSTQICDLLSSQPISSDFKITETIAYQTQKTVPQNSSQIDNLLVKIELPVVDFYNPISNLTMNQLNDPVYKNEQQVRLIPLSELSHNQKLLSIDSNYYLDDPTTGAIFTFLTINSDNQDNISKIKTLLQPLQKENLQKSELLSFAETGVTALTRRLTHKLNQVPSSHYFTEKIADFLKDKTYTHISNEVSFQDPCQGGFNTLVLCTDWRMIDAISSLGTDIIELTGNHNNDTGFSNNLKTIEKYRKLGLKLVGGGENSQIAKQPLDLGENLRLFAYNYSTSSIANNQLASTDHPGANPYNEVQAEQDFLVAKQDHKFIIVNVQFFECYAYPDAKIAYPLCDQPIDNQQSFFRHLIDLGADLVVGTSAHQPQTFELYKDKPIFYGLGNLFFDQIYWPDTRRSLILTHYFKDNSFLQTRISPTIYDESFQTRLLDHSEATAFLSRLTSASPKGN